MQYFLDPFIVIKCPSLSLAIIFAFKSFIFSHFSSLNDHCLSVILYLQYIFFHYSTFNVSVSLNLKYGFCRQYIFESNFFNSFCQSFPLTGMSVPFMLYYSC